MSDDPRHDSGLGDDDADDNPQLSDDDIWQALQRFEHEVGDADAAGSQSTDGNPNGDVPPDDDTLGDFDDELEGLLGNKAKAAMILTRLTSAELLAAFCQVTDISAECVAGEQGAVAMLRNLEADAPERAARGLTTVVSGLVVVLDVYPRRGWPVVRSSGALRVDCLLCGGSHVGHQHHE